MKLILFTLNSKYDLAIKEQSLIFSNNWVNFFEEKFLCVGLPPQKIHLLNNLHKNNIKCIILTGGNDVIERNNYNFSRERNNFELNIISFSIKNNIPLLGICRGMHIINLYFGGKIKKNLNNKEKKLHLKNHHSVFLENRIKKILNLNKIFVNSYHSQGFYKNDLGTGLKVGGASKDNIVEAIYHEKHNIYGLQWHPERNKKISIYDKKIINKIIRNL